MFDSIPAGLESLEPGPVLAALLSSIDISKVSGYDRIVVLRASQRMASHYEAETYAAMVSVRDVMEDDHPFYAAQAAAAEIRSALRLTRRAADADLGLALDLHERLPEVGKALAGGAIDIRRARTIAMGVCHLEDDTARAVVDRIIDDAPRLTTGQLHARIAQLAIETDPEQARRRYEDAVADRRVALEPTVDGTANLCGWDLPPDRAAAVCRRVDQMARSLRRSGDTRTIDQLRADVFLDLLAGRADARRRHRAVVDIRVDLTTLSGLSESPGDLAGYGPVIADIARQTVADQPDAEWRFVVTEPGSGRPVATGVTRRRPTAAQRRMVHAAHPTCVFPGCRMPANACDLDHRIPWSHGGPTTPGNLPPLCRYDHDTNRHRIGWTYQPLLDGDFSWRSPLGHLYTTSGHPP